MSDFETTNLVLDSDAASTGDRTDASESTSAENTIASDPRVDEKLKPPMLKISVEKKIIPNEMVCKTECKYLARTYPDSREDASPLAPLLQMLSELSYDGNDMIQCGDTTLLPTIPNLIYAVDRHLETYYSLQFECLKNKQSPLPDAVLYFVELQFRKGYKDRKRQVFPLPELTTVETKDGKQRLVPAFAYRAQMLLLAQRLFLRKDASTALFSPENLCCFISRATQRAILEYEKRISGKEVSLTGKKLQKYAAEKIGILQDGTFALEDYIVFERATACSFFVEVAGALSVVSEDARNACLNVITEPKTLSWFLDSPCIVSRIALARQFVFEVDHVFQRQFCGTKLEGSEITDAQLIAARKVLSTLSTSWKGNMFIPDCIGMLVKTEREEQGEKNAGTQKPKADIDLEKKSRCRDKAYSNIQAITEPLNLCAYAENPIYGPVAFCNPKHTDIVRMLKDIAAYNQEPSKPKQKKPKTSESDSFAWSLFSELCTAAENLYFPTSPSSEIS